MSSLLAACELTERQLLSVSFYYCYLVFYLLVTAANRIAQFNENVRETYRVTAIVCLNCTRCEWESWWEQQRCEQNVAEAEVEHDIKQV